MAIGKIPQSFKQSGQHATLCLSRRGEKSFETMNSSNSFSRWCQIGMRFPLVIALLFLAAVQVLQATDETTSAKTPEEERATFTLPPGFEVELVAAEDPAHGIGRFVPIAFDATGALWT